MTCGLSPQQSVLCTVVPAQFRSSLQFDLQHFIIIIRCALHFVPQLYREHPLLQLLTKRLSVCYARQFSVVMRANILVIVRIHQLKLKEW